MNDLIIPSASEENVAMVTLLSVINDSKIISINKQRRIHDNHTLLAVTLTTGIGLDKHATWCLSCKHCCTVFKEFLLDFGVTIVQCLASFVICCRFVDLKGKDGKLRLCPEVSGFNL